MDHPNDRNYGWSSAKFRKGIYKRVGYILTIVVAMVADYLIFNIANHIGVDIIANTMFGLLVSVWFILNELLSILENAGRMGAELPEFLKKVLSELKRSIENDDDIKKS